MTNVVLTLSAAIAIFVFLWRKSEKARAEVEADYAALRDASKASMDAAEEARAVLEEQEKEIKALQKAHSAIKKGLKEASEEIDRSAGSPAKIAGLWNKTFTGEK